MNLTTPPPVEDLDPDYADRIRRRLVEDARSSGRRRPVWVPALAAACGIAVITIGVVVLTRTGGGWSGGDGSGAASAPATSTPSPAQVQKVPAGKSRQMSLDLGPASSAEAKAAARQCLQKSAAATGAPNPATPADAETATVHQARWLKVLPGQDGELRPARDRMLLQTFTTRKDVWVECLDSQLADIFDPVLAGTSREKALPLNAAEPINGSWTIRDLPDGRSTLLFTDFTFVTMPDVARVEIRIRWTGGASPWYGVAVVNGSGYVAASQPGAIHEKHSMEIDYRTLDKAGRVTSTDIEYG
jgi:hypothetical protein